MPPPDRGYLRFLLAATCLPSSSRNVTQTGAGSLLVAQPRTKRSTPAAIRRGFKEGLIKQSPYTAQVGAEARKHADDAKAQLTAGTYPIFRGPLADNKGQTVIASGTTIANSDVKLESMNYLVAGVLGSTS